MYGGIQNSKVQPEMLGTDRGTPPSCCQDYPQCPYLVSTVWQYGDSEVGGWVYDQSLTVTCPANTCRSLRPSTQLAKTGSDVRIVLGTPFLSRRIRKSESKRDIVARGLTD